MYDHSSIENRLRTLNRLYDQSMMSEDLDLPILYSKIAIIELGGWVEEVRDYFAEKLLNKLFMNLEFDTPSNIIGRVSGFDYPYFKDQVFQVLVGMHGVAEIESRLDIDTHVNLKSNLGTLWAKRNCCAHRSLDGTMEKIQAPSTTIKQFNHIKKGLDDIDKSLDEFIRDRKEQDINL